MPVARRITGVPSRPDRARSMVIGEGAPDGEGTDAIDGREREAVRLEALARVAGAAAPTSDIEDLLEAVAAGVEDAFGLEVVVNLEDPETGRYTVRAATAGPSELLGTSSHAD